MPIYGYRCSRGHQFEVMQRITEDALTACPECGAPVIRVFHPVGIIFKGQGFYKTDSRGASADSGDGKAASTAKETKASTESKDSGSKKSDSSSEKSESSSTPGSPKDSTTT